MTHIPSNYTLPEALALFSNTIPSSLHTFLLSEYDTLLDRINELELEAESLQEELEIVREDRNELLDTVAMLEDKVNKLQKDVDKDK